MVWMAPAVAKRQQEGINLSAERCREGYGTQLLTTHSVQMIPCITVNGALARRRHPVSQDGAAATGIGVWYPASLKKGIGFETCWHPPDITSCFITSCPHLCSIDPHVLLPVLTLPGHPGYHIPLLECILCNLVETAEYTPTEGQQSIAT